MVTGAASVRRSLPGMSSARRLRRNDPSATASAQQQVEGQGHSVLRESVLVIRGWRRNEPAPQLIKRREAWQGDRERRQL